MVNETLAARFVSNEISNLVLTDALVGIGSRLGSPKYGLAQITALQTLLSEATTTLTNKTFDLGVNTLTGSLAEFNTALQGDSFFPLSGGVTVTGDVVINAKVSCDATELTISGGVITATRNFHKLDTEADAASDDLDTINGSVDGMILTLTNQGDSRTIVVKHGTGNIRLTGGADFSIPDRNDTLMLVRANHRSSWLEISRSTSA